MSRDRLTSTRFLIHWTGSGLRMAHRISGSIVGTYAIAHLVNHLCALGSIAAHIYMMDALRPVYRSTVVEPMLWMAAAFQGVSGLYFIQARWGERHGFFDRLQALSGGYLALFLLAHIGAIAFGRFALNLDTNFYYAAAGMHVAPFQLFFVPYYFLAVFALCAHGACAIHWLLRERVGVAMRNTLAISLLVAGLAVSTLIVLAFGGAFYTVTIPQQYRATYL